MTARWAPAIRVVHVAFVTFLVCAPFSSNARVLVLHYLCVPLVWLHWLTNDQTCVLTLLEKRARNVENDESFFHALLSPVFNISDEGVRRACWAASAMLWSVTASKVSCTDVAMVLAATFTTTTTRTGSFGWWPAATCGAP